MSDDIKINVGVKSSVSQGMKSVSSDISGAMSGIKNALGTLGIGLGFGAIVAGVKSVISSLGEIKDAAAMVDFSPQNYQKLTIVASEAGIKADQLSASLGKMIKAQENLSSDTKMQDAFKSLGISIDAALTANPEQLFEMIAQGLVKTGDKSAIFDIFGRGAAKLIPTLNDVADGFEKISKQGIISDKDLEQLDKLDEKLATVGRTLKGWGVDAVRGLVNFFDRASAMNAALLTGGDPRKALKDLAASNNAPATTKAATDKKTDDEEASKRRLSEYNKKLADEDAAWTKGIIEAEEKDRRALMKDRFAQDIKDAEEAENLKMDNKKKSIELDKEALEEEKKGILDAAELQKQKDDDRRDRLENILQKQGRIANKLLTDTDSNESWQGALARDRKAKSDAERGGRQVAQAQARIDKGVGTARDFALIGGMDAQREAKAARDELIKMDKDAKKAARETADNTAKIEKNIDALAKQINNIARG
jgi:hypothetical protein